MTSEKRFEVTVNFNTNQFEIYDRFNHDGRLEIYNDLGCVQFSSAPALCKVLNEFVTKCHELEKQNNKLKDRLFEAEKDYLIETADISDKLYLDKEIEELKKELKK